MLIIKYDMKERTPNKMDQSMNIFKVVFSIYIYIIILHFIFILFHYIIFLIRYIINAVLFLFFLYILYTRLFLGLEQQLTRCKLLLGFVNSFNHGD